jgi:hypothetical protein
MLGNPASRVSFLAPLILLLAAACGSSSPAPAVVHTNAAAAVEPVGGQLPPGLLEQAEPSRLTAGVSLAPLRIPKFIFGPEVPAEAVQPGSLRLAALVPAQARLHVLALPSPSDTAALNLVEDSTPRLKWGNVLIPAEHGLFGAFAADQSLGKWLVIVDWVNVKGGASPIPVTAYLWPRSAVMTYWHCGIPRSAIDACTDAFYMASDTILVNTSPVAPRG